MTGAGRVSLAAKQQGALLPLPKCQKQATQLHHWHSNQPIASWPSHLALLAQQMHGALQQRRRQQRQRGTRRNERQHGRRVPAHGGDKQRGLPSRVAAVCFSASQSKR